MLNKSSKRSEVSEVSELSSHRELIAYIGARVQNLQFMTFRVLDELSYVLKNTLGQIWSKYVKQLRIR